MCVCVCVCVCVWFVVLFLFDTEAFSYILFFRHKSRAKVYIFDTIAEGRQRKDRNILNSSGCYFINDFIYTSTLPLRHAVLISRR